MQKRRKFLLLLLLFAFVGVISGGIYSYWAGTIANPANVEDTQSIVIGEGKDVTTEINVTKALQTAGKKLVPAGKVAFSKGADNVDKFEYSFKVKWKDATNTVKPADNVTGTLTVKEAVTLTGKGGTDRKALVNVTLTPSTGSIKLNDTADFDVKVEVTLTEPANKSEYDDIINQNISLKLTFSVAQ